ncbi:class I tRNA ligase family protein, partial [Treponema socranskii]|uniref:class I tRNA ligase family protein n=1 Tax=Treponema socranskii TaxID=53419 RepID=UPI0028EC0686
MSVNKKLLCHWADRVADTIVSERGERDLYTCASGITPSGTVHIGNFREIITVDLVVRALRDRGKNVRFIYSWDDYDVFRKVPANMPNQDEL